jgi:hypothetical protein
MLLAYLKILFNSIGHTASIGSFTVNNEFGNNMG